MEKFGLMDLIDKISDVGKSKGASGSDNFIRDGKDARTGENNGESRLRKPDVPPQPQYLMNKKLAAYVEKHDRLAAEIAEKNNKRT